MRTQNPSGLKRTHFGKDSEEAAGGEVRSNQQVMPRQSSIMSRINQSQAVVRTAPLDVATLYWELIIARELLSGNIPIPKQRRVVSSCQRSGLARDPKDLPPTQT
jgi:hypothetical protein